MDLFKIEPKVVSVSALKHFMLKDKIVYKLNVKMDIAPTPPAKNANKMNAPITITEDRTESVAPKDNAHLQPP